MIRAFLSRVGVVAGALGLMVAAMGVAPVAEAQRWGGTNRGGDWSAGRGAGGNFSVERVIRLADELELTAEQREQLEAIRVELLGAHTTRAVRRMELLSEIRAGIREPEAMRGDARELAGQARETLSGMRDRYDAILTEEQREELRQLNRRTAWRGNRDLRNGRGSERFDRVREARDRGAMNRWRAATDRWREARDRRGGRGSDEPRPGGPGRPGGGSGS